MSGGGRGGNMIALVEEDASLAIAEALCLLAQSGPSSRRSHEMDRAPRWRIIWQGGTICFNLPSVIARPGLHNDIRQNRNRNDR
jgi:hypothetical protein